MKIALLLGVFLGGIATAFSQSGFFLPENKVKDRVAFELVNNLVVIPVEVNGTKLSFLLDTGVNATILFGVSQDDSLELRNTRPLKIRGLGDGGSIDALRSKNNTVKIGDAVDNDHTIYVIFEQALNLSPRMGLPVHGILGYDFFKKFIVRTDYIGKRIVFYNPEKYTPKICSNCEVFNLTMHENKPYVDITISSETFPKKATLLIDSGSSDALWLFDETGIITESPKNYFEDFLGLGLSGNIFGKRSRLKEASLGDFKLRDVHVAFPNKNATDSISFYKERNGSLGGEILKRFSVIMDYPNQRMILKKNGNFNDSFHYNMSGITVEHDGLVVVKDEKDKFNNLINTQDVNETNGAVRIYTQKVYSFFLAPKFVVADVRGESPAALAGIEKGDEIISINNTLAYRYKLYELVELFSSKEGRNISLIIERNGIQSKVRFTLKKII
ncbi:PDZ domain-containing protein [Ulvibacter sp. MAR_2010_11]|uniref:aspartyl protease family protein n=1 Tax=Ulvibacter sp. MAR_2010_11 TaxID=1250229 RepID=UPI000CB1DC7F|nr:aspartyl protease family protein [Ulvibacter sp. MAR_2010_11]PKA82255.1 PDZ domain-containing protein [Ulvibacter sp. MAR_2010_11]